MKRRTLWFISHMRNGMLITEVLKTAHNTDNLDASLVFELIHFEEVTMATNESESSHWQHTEIESLLKIWARKDIQKELESMHQNLPVYEKIASELAVTGINRSAISCRDKIKKMKFKYRRFRERKGHKKGSFKFYELLRSVLGDSLEEGVSDSHQIRRPNSVSHSDNIGSFHSNQFQDYDQVRYSPNVVSNDSNSIVLSDTESESDYDMYMKDYGSDEDYVPEENSHYCETQPASSTSHATESPPQTFPCHTYGHMFMHAGSGRVVTSTRSENHPRDDSTSHPVNTSPLNAARVTMKRRAELIGRGCRFARGMIGPFGPCRRGHGKWHRGGHLARMEQSFDTMFNKMMQGQKDTQERFLSSHEKQLEQHLQFELQRQELMNKQREEDRKHQMDMFEMMMKSFHQNKDIHLSHQASVGQNNQQNCSNQQHTRQFSSSSSRSQREIMSVSEVKSIWKSADAVCFDVDSTVLKDEGVDELAKFCGVGQEVAEWTQKAMGGGISFRVALRERLNIIKPSRQQLSDFIASHSPQFSDRICDLVNALRKRGKSVYLVSGGFRSLIEPAAKILSISPDHVFANKLKFYFSGDYAGFDESQPTSDSGGKPKVMQMIKDRYQHKKLVMVGDGATDLEAAPPADAFIGYGGNVVRESVKSRAPWFVTDFRDLINELDSSN